MAINEGANQSRNADWEQSKNPVVPAKGIILARDKRSHFEVVAHILNNVLPGAPRELESAQPCIRQRRPPKIQYFETMTRIVLYGLPHHQVVPTETLLRFIRSAVLKNRLLPKVKKHSAGHGSSSLARQHNNASFPGEDIFMNLEEKSKRLRWEAVFLSRPALQRVELAQGLQIL